MTLIIAWGFVWETWTPKHSQTPCSLREEIPFGMRSPRVGELSKRPQELTSLPVGKTGSRDLEMPFPLHRCSGFQPSGVPEAVGVAPDPTGFWAQQRPRQLRTAVWGNTGLSRRLCWGSFRPSIWGFALDARGRADHTLELTLEGQRATPAVQGSLSCAVPGASQKLAESLRVCTSVASTPGASSRSHSPQEPAAPTCTSGERPASRQEPRLAHQGAAPWPALPWPAQSGPGSRCFPGGPTRGNGSARSSAPGPPRGRRKPGFGNPPTSAKDEPVSPEPCRQTLHLWRTGHSPHQLVSGAPRREGSPK